MVLTSSGGEDHEALPCWGFRHVVIFLAFLGATFSLALRVNLSVALVAMVNSSSPEINGEFHNSSCGNATLPNSQHYSESILIEVAESTNHSVTYFGAKFDWDEETQSFLLSSMLYGVTLSQMFSGVVTQRFGIRWVFGISSLIFSILSLLTPAVCGNDAAAVIAVRFVQGILQGTLCPVLHQSVSRWLPVKERSRGFAFVFNGNQIGVIAGMFISGILCDSEMFGGWPSAFYVFGVAGCLWSVIWLALVTDFPQQNPYTSRREADLIQSAQDNKQPQETAVPWRMILTSIPVWSQTIGVTGRVMCNISYYRNAVWGTDAIFCNPAHEIRANHGKLVSSIYRLCSSNCRYRSSVSVVWER